MSNLHPGGSGREPRYLTIFAMVAAGLVIFAATTVFRIRDYTDKSIDLQVLFKMMGVALSLMVPTIALVSRRLTLSTPVLLAWLAMLISLVLSSAQAINFGLSLMNSVAMLGCFLFCVWMTERLGEDRVASVLVSLVGFIAICSLVVYFVYPELGRMRAWLGSEFGENNRIQGIAGTPNGLGSMTAMSLIFTLLYFGRVEKKVRSLMLMAAVPSAVCLIMSNSRMSMASLIVCATVYLASKGNRAANAGIIALGVAAVAALFFSAPDMFLSSLARSGDASEITSATGRSEIWAVVLEHVAARPLTGYGYGMSTSILPMDPRLFSVAAHTHNMYLEVLFSGGAISFSLLMVAVVSTLYVGLRTGCIEPVIILLFYLLRGLTEPAPFDNLPSFAGYAFFLAVAFIVARARRADEGKQRARASIAARSLARCRLNLSTVNGPAA